MIHELKVILEDSAFILGGLDRIKEKAGIHRLILRHRREEYIWKVQ